MGSSRPVTASPPSSDAPPQGAPEVQTTVDGIVEKYCTRCKNPQWRQGPKAHTTSEHRGGRPGQSQQHLFMGPIVPTPPPKFVTPVADPPTLVPLPQQPSPPLAQDTTTPTNVLTLTPGLLDSQPIATPTYAAHLEVDPFDDVDIFVDAYSPDTAIVNLLTKVCDDSDVDLDVFYDAVDTLQEGDDDACCSTPCTNSFTLHDFSCLLPILTILLAIYCFYSYRLLLLLLGSLIPPSIHMAINGVVFSKWVQSGIIKSHYSFAYPCKYFILSCVMLSMSFCSWFGMTPDAQMSVRTKLTTFLGVRPPPKPPNKVKPQPSCKSRKKIKSKSKIENLKSNINKIHNSNTKVNLKRLALISALGILNSLPIVNTTVAECIKRRFQKDYAYTGYLCPSLIKDPVLIETVKEYINHDLPQHDLIDGAFTCIVDSGCSTSATPYKEDFEHLTTLNKPVELNGIAGKSTVTKGGILKYQCINSKGEVVVIKTFGFYDHHLKVQLFSPQSYFLSRPKKDGQFTISWSRVFLQINNDKVTPDVLPCMIDKNTFMPLLTCFHDVDKVAANLLNQGVDEKDSDNLTAIQRQLLCYHCKLGHLGFKYLKWVLSGGIFGPQGIQCSHKEIPHPKCQACIQGGQQRNPTAGNIHTQKNKGILKREQLSPGQRIFSDQYVSSVEGRNYTGRSQSQSSLSYKGGTIFVDAASSYIYLNHQLGFTAIETIKSKVAFEREAASVGNHITGYNTDNGVYTSKEFTQHIANNQQTLHLSGVGAHHQNGPAENAIKNVSRRARIFMLHAAIKWPQHYNKALWPLATFNDICCAFTQSHAT